jgi:hypothetical protein
VLYVTLARFLGSVLLVEVARSGISALFYQMARSINVMLSAVLARSDHTGALVGSGSLQLCGALSQLGYRSFIMVR